MKLSWSSLTLIFAATLFAGCGNLFHYPGGAPTSDNKNNGGGGGNALVGLQFPSGMSERTKAALTILNNRCVSCHNASSGATAGGGLVEILDPRQMLISGLIVPGDAARSPLYDSIVRSRMPKAAPLSAADQIVIRDWINLDLTASPIGFANFTVMPLTNTFSSLRANIISTRCLVCHGGAEGVEDNVSYASYALTMQTVRANNVAGSKFYTSSASGEMPERFHRLTALELQVISDWINVGAPNN